MVNIVLDVHETHIPGTKGQLFNNRAMFGCFFITFFTKKTILYTQHMLMEVSLSRYENRNNFGNGASYHRTDDN